MEENKKPQGWKDVEINGQIPMDGLMNFFNILNQRLANVEDNVFIRDENNQMVSLSEIYARQAAAEMAKQEQQETKEN